MNDFWFPDDEELATYTFEYEGNVFSGDSNWGINKEVNEKCSHKWKPILLLFSTVYDCEICGKKKEDN